MKSLIFIPKFVATYIRRQRAGSQEYGDKKIREDQPDYDVTSFEDDAQEQQVNQNVCTCIPVYLYTCVHPTRRFIHD